MEMLKKYYRDVLLVILTIVVICLIRRNEETNNLAFFNVKGTLNHFTQLVAEKQGLTQQQRNNLIAIFTSKMEQVEKEYAKTNGLQIIVSSAAIAGIPDVTQDIQSQIIKEIKEGKNG